MLHRETVESSTFNILIELMQMPALGQFQLVGGTALALQFGHRISIDLDLFSTIPFDNETIINALILNFKSRFQLSSRLENKLGVFGYIDGIKVDICNHPSLMVDDILVIEGVRMWSAKEIAAAKVNAVSRRATKKDFWDIDLLLETFSINEIAEFYRKKYLPMLAIGVAQMLVYFEEAENSPDPVCLRGKSWDKIKSNIFSKINLQTK